MKKRKIISLLFLVSGSSSEIKKNEIKGVEAYFYIEHSKTIEYVVEIKTRKQ